MCLDKQESLRQLRWAKLLRHFLKLIKKKNTVAFHIEYGTENTMMFAINLLSISVDHLNQMIHETPEFITLQEKGIKLLTKTMYLKFILLK